MTKKLLKQKVGEMINSGKAKQEIFEELIAQGENLSTVASLIASHHNKQRYEENYWKINILVWMMLILGLLQSLSAYTQGLETSTTYAWILAIIGASIPLLYAYGFYKNKLIAYNLFIIGIFIGIIWNLATIFDAPTTITAVNLLIEISLIAYVWYVRACLFPDIRILSPKKVNGQYSFDG